MATVKKTVWIFSIFIACILIFTVSFSIPILSRKSVDIRRDYGIRGIALADGNNATAYIYVTKDELARYRDTTEFWIKDPERISMLASHDGALVQVGETPISEAELYEKFGKDNPEIKKIIPKEDFYELQVSFDRSTYNRGISVESEAGYDKDWLAENKVELEWITEGDIEYALCVVYCKGISVGSAYDHMFGQYADPEGYLD